MTEPYDHEQPGPTSPTEPVTAPPAPEPQVAHRRTAPWVGLLTTLGVGLAAVVTAQVLTAIAQGMAMKSTDPQTQVPGTLQLVKHDIFHRLGYAFGNLGGTAVLFLVVAVILVSLPPILGAVTSDRHELVASIALGLTTVMAVIIAAGSILTVRYQLHLYSATHRSVPSYVRVQLISFLLGALGTAAVALFGSVAALGLRDRREQALAAAIAEEEDGPGAEEPPLGDPTLPR
jgi:hypothetical protein